MLSRTTSLPPDIILDASCSPTSNVEMIRLCLDMGSDIHTVSPPEETALHVALAASQVSEVICLENLQVLIDAGCNPSRHSLYDETPLPPAVRNGFVSIVKYLLALHVPLPSFILLTASETVKASMIRLLIDNGAYVRTIAPNGDTPLHRVLLNRQSPSEEYLDCVQVLINSGCNPCLPNALGKTPFVIAAENGHLQVVQYLYNTLNSPLPPDILLSVAGSTSLRLTPVIRFLIDKGASMHAAHASGNTLLHLAMARSWDRECLSRIRLLVNAGCDPRVHNLAGETPFHFAARQGHISVMEYLLSLGIPIPSNLMHAQLDRGYSFGVPPRHSAIRFLLEKGVDVYTVAKNGDTLLHLAASIYPEEHALELARHLVHAGCIPCVLNSSQETPMHIAARKGSISIIKFLLSLDASLPPDILLAASIGYSSKTELIRYLVEEGANVSVATTDGDSPLHLLITRGDEDDRLECVKILVDAGCDPGAQNLAGETPLHAAARHGFDNILEYFLSRGVPLPDNILPLASGTLTTIRFLVGRGLDLRSVAVDDVTKLMHRALNSPRNSDKDCVECAKTLINTGWNPSLKNAAGETAIHASVRNAKIGAIKFFLSQNVPLPSDVFLAALSPLSDVPPGGINDYTRRALALTYFLIREGAHVNVAGSDGNTPLHLVMMRNTPLNEDHTHLERLLWTLTEVLLDAGADPSVRNMDGRTLYDLAEAKGQFFNENFLRVVGNVHVCAPR
ncbi:ankyrin repeat-containing domain protein [Boletus coccyginus]|nr:ankyrin repeat-containing domain protein [Boletus coccyginus]